MSKSNMQHQHEQDDAAEIADLVAELKVVMSEALDCNEAFVVMTSKSALTYDRDNVVDEMITVDSDAFNWAAVAAGRDPIEAAKVFAVLKAKAIKRIVNQASLAAMAKNQFYKRDEAA